LASQRPLLLVLDDLQWSDLGSSSLLFHLSQRLVLQRNVAEKITKKRKA
jgi:predicted ATPase